MAPKDDTHKSRNGPNFFPSPTKKIGFFVRSSQISIQDVCCSSVIVSKVNCPSSNNATKRVLLTGFATRIFECSPKDIWIKNQFKKTLWFWCNHVVGSKNKNGVELEEESFGHGYYMRRCVELAKKAIGHTNPNPMVGCVIVKEGKIVGEGFHPKAGEPHAEVFALRDAGDQAENGTAYVSLEPCNHYGRTPPCTEALIKAKVKTVVVGMVDPNPIVASTGVKRLQEACVKVTVGVEEELCKRLNEVFVHHILTKKPFVTLRYSMSLDGHILNHLDDEAVKCGGYYSRLLQEYDAIILSSSALSENSSFPVSNEPGSNQPVKIVLSKSHIQIPVLDKDESSKFIIISEKDSSLEPHTVQEGIQTLTFDRINLLEILENCKRLGLCSILLDLRGDIVKYEDILQEGFELNSFQKVVVEVLPFLDSSRERASNIVDLKAKAKTLTSFVSGQSVILEGYF